MLAAVIQTTSTSDEAASLEAAEALVRRALAYGAKLVVTPEQTNFLGPHTQKVQIATALDGPVVARFAALAKEAGATVVLGSFNERSPEPGRCYNTSVVLGTDGNILAYYRKIHLFDVDLGAAVRFQESATTVPGAQVVVANTPAGPIGLSVCYDLRFPELYRALLDEGAELITVPSAFTLTTGKDHWEPLLRARAIETQCWVLAAAQFGHHDDDGLRQSFGHSCIIDPWGLVVGMAADGPGLALAEIDRERVARLRRSMPISNHRRLGVRSC
jgi:predicted amidohydrolase